MDSANVGFVPSWTLIHFKNKLLSILMDISPEDINGKISRLRTPSSKVEY